MPEVKIVSAMAKIVIWPLGDLWTKSCFRHSLVLADNERQEL
jgi:hypothetical protein